jgi:hypothetical protein
MINIQSLAFFDISAIIIMFVLAYLSKRLGNALKIKPYYKILYITAVLIISASTIDMITESFHMSTLFYISMTFRFVSSVVAFFVCLRYWNWLFSEFLKH